MFFKSLLIVCFSILSLVVRGQSFNADDIMGTWLTAEQTGEITIFKDGEYYFGRITAGKREQKFDIHNPNKDKRSRPLLGLVILKDLEFDSKNDVWEDGTIYDPENGKQYSCNVKLLNAKTLKITGYIGFSWIGRSEQWTRIK